MTINPAKGQTDQWTEESMDVPHTDQESIFNKGVQSIPGGKQALSNMMPDTWISNPRASTRTLHAKIVLSKTVQTQLDVHVQKDTFMT